MPACDFLGELNLLTGQAVYVTARVQQPGRIIRIGLGAFRQALAEHADIADIMLQALRLRRHNMQEDAASALEIIGHRNTAATRALSIFASRLQLPHRTHDPRSRAGLDLMSAHGLDADDLPAAAISGTVLRRAAPRDIADVVGLSYQPAGHNVDLIVIGAGPAGLAAAVYAASEGLATVLLDATGPGGQAASSSRIENYLGFPAGISGEELTRLALVQALKFGAQVYTTCEVAELEVTNDGPTVTLANGTAIPARAAIVATGARYRRLDLSRVADFERAGSIRYSATEHDVDDCGSRPVAVVGGANSAAQAAIYLASRGSRVELIIRENEIEGGMSAYLSQRLWAHPDVHIRTSSQVSALKGDVALTSIDVEHDDGTVDELECCALFCFIGAEPSTQWLNCLARDDDGFLLTDDRLPTSTESPAPRFQTSAAGVFAAGDVRAGSMKRVAAAVGEGASAVASVHAVLAAEPPGVG